MADQTDKALDPRWAWQPYVPSDQVPWDLKRVGHFLRRTTFGATHTQMQQALKAGADKTISRVLRGEPHLADFEKETARLAESIARANNGPQASAWWLYRMLYTPHPLKEKLTLFWHNHFATSFAKVQNASYMLKQYELLHTHALGNFAEMLKAMSYDPAMLVWLDGKESKKGNPNENYARELMELFSLGRGHYTEQDIREAARAFTGWSVKGPAALFTAAQHDDSPKTVFKQKGNWKPDDIVRLCLEQESAPYFILGKLFRFLVSETIEPTQELLEPLARQFRQSGFDFGKVVETVVRSNLFFSPLVYRTRIKAPVDFALGIVRGLEGRIGTVTLVDALADLGQNVFNPPSVKGWDGGKTWLNGQTLLYRQNLALAITSTEDARFGQRCDPAVLARKHNKKADGELVEFFLELFLQNDVPADDVQRLRDYMERSHKQPVPVYWTAQDITDNRVRTLCHLVLTLPEFQLD